MACRLFGAKPLPEPMLPYCQLDFWEHTSVKFESKYNPLHSWKFTWICRFGNGGYFVQGEKLRLDHFRYLSIQWDLHTVKRVCLTELGRVSLHLVSSTNKCTWYIIFAGEAVLFMLRQCLCQKSDDGPASMMLGRQLISDANCTEDIYIYIYVIETRMRFREVVNHYNNVIMDAMAAQITSLTIVYSTVYSGADQRKHQSFASLDFVRGIHRWPVNSPHKRPVTRENVSNGWRHNVHGHSIQEFSTSRKRILVSMIALHSKGHV